MEKDARIFVAGYRGMVGSALVRKLKHEGFNNLLLKTSAEVDLRNQSSVESLFASEKPHYVFLAAARVGGIMANTTFRAEFLYDNLMIASNVIHQSYVHGVKKLLFLGSSCIYPRMAPQPLSEEHLLTGPLEYTNEPYAIAKIAGIKLCENYGKQYGARFISCMPCNLYGPNDNYDLNGSHVLPSLIRKFVVAKRNKQQVVNIWGSGKPLREFLHVDDLADACLRLMEKYEGYEPVNVGSGEEVSITALAELIKSVVGFEGSIEYDSSKPDGTPRKVMNSEKISGLGWKAKIPLAVGIKKAIADFEREHREMLVS